MKVARFSVPVSAILVIGLNQSALAGPQSLLDPYATVRPPARKAPVKKPQMVTPRVVPTSVQLGEPLSTGRKEKPLADKPIGSSKPLGSSGDGGFISGTKEIFHGIGTATKAAVVAPTVGLVHGTKALGGKVADGTKGLGEKVADGTKGIGSKVADGSKSSGGFFVKGVKSIGSGFKTAGSKMGDGLKVAGEKVKDGTAAAGHAIASTPKAVLKHGDKGEKIADAKPKDGKLGEVSKTEEPEKIVDTVTEKSEKLADAKPAPETKAKDGGESLGGKVLGMPKAAAKGIAGVAGKTGEGAKKLATAPLGVMGKLNPFHKKEAPAPQTAAKEKAAPQ